MHRQLILILVTLACFAFNGLSQQIEQYIDDEYTSEDVFGINKGTNGGLISGFYYRHSKFIGTNSLMNYGVEIVHIKHPRESRRTSLTGTGRTFVFGKSNYLLAIHPTYGREKILFKKAPQQGARITALAVAGPSFGLEVPYFIELSNGRREQYDPENPIHSAYSIQGASSPLRGITQGTIVLGVHAKASLTFETNSAKKRVFGIELGFSVDAYTREINILPEATNRSIYTAAFGAIYFGRRR